MPAQVIAPHQECQFDQDPGPVFFLAGPVRGADDWQGVCFEILSKHVSDCRVAIPVRYPSDHAFRRLKAAPGKQNAFEHLISWERFYLDMASTHGCIIFWLPCESRTHPRPRADGPYAQDTYGELGEWRGRLMKKPTLNVVIGAEEGFPGLSQIKRNFHEALGKEFEVLSGLENAVKRAVYVAKTRKHRGMEDSG